MEPSHEFRKYTIKTFTWCEMCSKFLWGARKQGIKCRVCRMTVHKACMDRANTTSHCSQRLFSSHKSSGSIIENMSVNRKKVALETTQEIIIKEEYIRPHRVDVFLALITNLSGYTELNEQYACFTGKIVTTNTTENDLLCMNFRFSVGEEVLNTLSVLSLWIERSILCEERIAALKILVEISKLEENKDTLITVGPIDALIKLFIPIITRSEADIITIEEAKYAQLIFTILKNVFDTKERLITLVDNNQLQHIIFFLKILKKIEAGNLGIYKSKQNRLILRAAIYEGYRFIEPYLTHFYDKDDRVTDYLCSLQTLDLIMDACVKNVISIAKEINPSEIKIKKLIYSSALCTVHTGVWQRKRVAVKIFDTNQLSWNRNNFIKEITMFTLIKHPNACPFFGAYTPPKSDNNNNSAGGKLLERPLILMPYFKNGSLADYIDLRRRQLEQRKLFGTRQVIDIITLLNMALNAADCIQYLHTRSIIHRDIKPANFLIDDDFEIRVTDFGVSRAMTDISTGEYTYSGTEVWMAPEVFDKYYDSKVDVYSYGLLLWSMLTGKTPYDRFNNMMDFVTEVISNARREKIPEFSPPVFPDLSQLIIRCWDADPRKRPDFTTICENLSQMKYTLTHSPFTYLYHGVEEREYSQILALMMSFMDEKTKISFSLTNSIFYKIFEQTKLVVL